MRTAKPWLLCGAFFSLPAAAYAASGGLDRIAVYAGSWHTETVHDATPYSKAGVERSTLRNNCWRGQAFYACEQIVDGKPRALVVFQPGKDDTHYVTHALPADDGPAGDGTLVVEGERWTFPWQFTDHGKTVYARTVNVFNGRDHIDFRQEYSLDRIHWTLMAKGFDKRLP